VLPNAHGRVRAFCLACAAALAAVAPSAACRRAAAAPEPLAVALVTPPGETRAAIDLTGLTDDERAALKNDAPDAVWESLLTVSVQAANPEATPPAVAGRYSVIDRGVRFTPSFPFQPGRRYDVRVDLGRFRRDEPRTLKTTLALPRGPTPAAEARVMGISPAGQTVPENLLRFYVYFSAPMSREAGLPHVTLTDERSGVVADAFLPVDGGFWNHDFTRYTLFFDPGRVKAGILPNERMGRPLVAGRRYRLAIATTWRDAQGAPLVEPFEHRFIAGPALTAALDLDTWQITLPIAGTRQPIVLRSPTPLDHAIALRAIGISSAGGEAVDGEVSLDVTDTRWQLVPPEPWRAGSYSVVALETLEDPAGNRIGRAFEAPIDDRRPQPPPRLTRPFRITPTS
jgi:hypothetical protein